MNHPDPSSPAPAPTWQSKEVFENAKQDFQAHLADVREAAAQTADEVRATASSTAAAARQSCQAVRQDATTHFHSYLEEIEFHIRQQPLKSVGLAALAGFVIGLLKRP